ncbi:hypothetical protein QBC39DRAFT_429959 [Podospora conica]|nr:hypothetical protein QBC39DRAFT_429959 [Schizothecium conicum]
MAATSDADWSGEGGYALSTLRPAENPPHTIGGSDTGTLQLDDENVLARYKDLSIDLYTDPCYAASSTGPWPVGFDDGNLSAAYNDTFLGQPKHHNWKPDYSGEGIRSYLWKLAHTYTGRAIGWWAPAALSSGLVIFTTIVVAADIRRQSYQLTGTASRARHRTLLRRYRWLVVFVLAPLLSVPLWSTSRLVAPSSIESRDSSITIPLLTFRSWADAAQNIQARLPTQNTSVEAINGHHPPVGGAAPDILHRQKRNAWQGWRLSGFQHYLAAEEQAPTPPPRVLEFKRNDTKLDKHSTDFWPSWNRTLDGDAFVMPFSSQYNFLDIATSHAFLHAPLRLLVPYLYCDVLHQGGSNSYSLAEKIDLFHDNCHSTFTLASRPLKTTDQETLKTTYDSEIHRMEQALANTTDTTPRAVYIHMEKRLQRLREDQSVLSNPAELYTLRPQWVSLQYRPGHNGTLPCERSLAFIGDIRPFRRVSETSIPRRQLSIAFCEVKFNTIDMMAWWHLRNSSFLLRGPTIPPLTASYLLSRGALIPKYGDDYKYTSFSFANFWKYLRVVGDFGLKSFDDRWQSVNGWYILLRPTDKAWDFKDLGQALVNQLQRTSLLDDSLWPHQLLQYGYYDAVKLSTTNVAALALGSKRLCSWFVEHLSEGADQAFAELVDNGGKTLQGRYGRLFLWRLEIFDFASSPWVRIGLVAVAIICTLIVRVSNRYSGDGHSGLPWSPETIAARASLLVRSRMRAAFASANHKPCEILAIPEVRVGQWKYQSNYVWRLDSKCNEIIVDQSTLASESHGGPTMLQSHSVSSLPVAAHPRIISGQLILFLAILCGTMSAMLAPANAFDIRVPQDALAVIMTWDATLEPSFRATLALMVLPQFLAFYLVACWDDLDQTFRARQPWASLASPGPADLNLTLNYMDGSNRLWKALRNKHYLIALLSVGSTMSFFLPVFTAGILRLEPRYQHVGETRSVRSHTWATQPADVLDVNLPNGIPLSAMNAIIRPPGEIKWVAHSHVLLPVELEISEDAPSPPHESFWRLRTDSLHSKLDCQVLNRSVPHHTASPDFDGHQPLTIEAVLPAGRFFGDGSTSITLNSCREEYTMFNASRLVETYKCLHWHLQAIRRGNEPELRPAWILVMLNGTLSQWAPSYGPILNPGFETSALLCEPQAYMSTGTAELVRIIDGGEGQSALHPRDFVPDQETELDISVSWAFSQVLNRSMHAEDLEPGGLSALRDAQTSTFSADLLGYLAIRNAPFTHGATMSDFYGTLFANTLAESTWLRRNSTTSVVLEHWQWGQVFRVRKFILFLVIVLVCFYLVGMAYLGIRRKEYLFPIAPEPLENSLFFLYQSTIVDMLEAIPHPEEMSIEAFHRKVESFGHKYVFGKYKDGNGHYEQFGVDRVEEFGPVDDETGTEEPRQQGAPRTQWRRYRDDSSESDSGGGDDEEARRVVDGRRGKRQGQRRGGRAEDGAREGGDVEDDLIDLDTREQADGHDGSAGSTAQGSQSTKRAAATERPDNNQTQEGRGSVDEVDDRQDQNPLQAGDTSSTPGSNDGTQKPSAASEHEEGRPTPTQSSPQGGENDRLLGERQNNKEVAKTNLNAHEDSSEIHPDHVQHQSTRIQDQLALAASGIPPTRNPTRPRALSLSDFPALSHLPEPGADSTVTRQRRLSASDAGASISVQPRRRALSLSDFPDVAHLPDPVLGGDGAVSV